MSGQSKAEAIKGARVGSLMQDSGWQFVYFKGANLMSGPGTRGFISWDARAFALLVQNKYPGMSDNSTRDYGKAVQVLAEDWSEHDNLVAFGDRVWDMERLDWVEDKLTYVYSSPIKPNDNTAPVLKFLSELARGDEGLVSDYLQAIAPLLMYRKPSGVIWFVGNGANGKSSLINAIYKMMGNRNLSSVTTAALEDGKATPVLSGVLGNIVRESSEARVEDTERYKAIGTHEPFTVRQLYTNDLMTIETNFHTIFNANNVPVFSDKTHGARRRTLVVPFKAVFADNPDFDAKTFTDDFLGGLLTLILEAAQSIRDNKYRYNWSDATMKAKSEYDSEVNSVEAFLKYMDESHILGFSNYQVLRLNYEQWCAQNGLVALGTTTLKRTVVNDTGAERRIVRVNNIPAGRYFFAGAPEELTWLDNGYGVRTPTAQAIEDSKNEEKQARLDGKW